MDRVRNGSRLYAQAKTLMPIYDRREFRSPAEFRQALEVSRTVYVGSIDPSTTEEQLYAYFRACGDIRRIIVGLQAALRTPCGFAFVEFYTTQAACCAAALCNGATPLFAAAHPQNPHTAPGTITVNQDPGFTPGRQYGRTHGPHGRYPAGGAGGSGGVAGRSPYRNRSSPFTGVKRAAPSAAPFEGIPPGSLLPPPSPSSSPVAAAPAAAAEVATTEAAPGEPEDKRVHRDDNDA